MLLLRVLLQSAVRWVRSSAVVCGRQNRHSNCNNFSPLIVVIIIIIRPSHSPHVSPAVEGRRRTGTALGGAWAGKNHLPPPPPDVAFQMSSINVKRANSRVKLGPSFAFRGERRVPAPGVRCSV